MHTLMRHAAFIFLFWPNSFVTSAAVLNILTVPTNISQLQYVSKLSTLEVISAGFEAIVLVVLEPRSPKHPNFMMLETAIHVIGKHFTLSRNEGARTED